MTMGINLTLLGIVLYIGQPFDTLGNAIQVYNRSRVAQTIHLPYRKVRIPRSRGAASSPSYDNSCGRRYIHKEGRRARILNGNAAQPGEFPWQISLQKKNRGSDENWKHICGGSLISKTAAISAAHCFLDSDPLSAYRVVVGSHSLNDTEFGQVFELEQGDYISHRHFGSTSEWDNDISFIRIRGPDDQGVRLNRHVQPICLPDTSSHFYQSNNCYISGWGAKNKNQPNKVSTSLQGAKIPLNNPDICEAAYEEEDVRDNYLRRILFPTRRRSVITVGNVCAGYIGGSLDYSNAHTPDSCYGDSGGPLACSSPDNPESFFLVGIVSWGKICGSRTHPGVYTKVSHYLSWIKNEESLSRSDIGIGV